MLADADTALASYAELRERLSALLADGSDEAARAAMVPGCPAWSVTDAVAHLTGVCIDIIDGNLAGAGTTAWADHQVERFAPLGLHALVERWGDVGSTVQGLAAAFPQSAASQFVFDATTHEHDIRGALGRPGARDASSVFVSLGFLENSLDAFVRANELATLALLTPDFSAVVGDGEAQVTLVAPTFELLRGLAGRRSKAQILALDWSGDATPYLALFDDSPLQLRQEALVE